MTCPPTAQMKGCRKNWLFGHCGMSRPSCCSVANLCLTLCDPRTAALQASVSFTISKNLLKFMSIESMIPSVSPSPPAFNLSQQQGLFQRVSSSYQVFNFSISISPSNEYSGLISFRIACFDLLAVQGLSRVFSSNTSRSAVDSLFFLQREREGVIPSKPYWGRKQKEKSLISILSLIIMCISGSSWGFDITFDI